MYTITRVRKQYWFNCTVVGLNMLNIRYSCVQILFMETLPILELISFF